MEIEVSEQWMKQEWSLLDPLVYLFDQMEEGADFAEATNTSISGGKVVNIACLLILRNGGTEKTCNQSEFMMVGQKNWQAFNDNFAQTYRR